jgi:hypothetical protein
MREWYAPGDVLGLPGERVVPETSAFEQTVETILDTSGLSEAAAIAPCPAGCERCASRG